MIQRRFNVIVPRARVPRKHPRVETFFFVPRSDGISDGLRWSFSYGAMLQRFPLAHRGPYWELFYERQCGRLPELPAPGALTVSLTRVSAYAPPKGANARVEVWG